MIIYAVRVPYGEADLPENPGGWRIFYSEWEAKSHAMGGPVVELRVRPSVSGVLLPTPENIRRLRESVGLTPTEAGALILKSTRTWNEYESGKEPMPPQDWYLFRLLVE